MLRHFRRHDAPWRRFICKEMKSQGARPVRRHPSRDPGRQGRTSTWPSRIMGRGAVRLGAVPQVEPAVRPDFRNITVMARKLVQDAEASRHCGTSAPSLLWRGRGEYDDCAIRTIETSGSQHERELEPASLRVGRVRQAR
jgi:hypothetical protein